MENNYGEDYYDVEVEDYDQLEELVELPQYDTEPVIGVVALVVVLVALALLCWPYLRPQRRSGFFGRLFQ